MRPPNQPPVRVARAAARRCGAIAAACAIACVAALTAGAQAQVEGTPITGDRLGGFVLPVEPGAWNAVFKSTHANTWKVDSTQRIYLDGKVNVQLGPYDFYAERAVVWIERIPSAKGVITQVAVWFPQTSEPTKAAGLGASGSNLLITASTMGECTLQTILPNPTAPKKNVVLRQAEERLRQYLQGIAKQPPALRTLPDVRRPVPPPPPPPLVVGGTALIMPPPAADTAPVAADSDAPTSAGPPTPPPVIAPESLVAFVADKVEIDTNKDVVTLTSGTTIDVLPRDPGGDSRALQLRAERGVIFLKPGSTGKLTGSTTQVGAGAVLGIYLEGDVTATDFDYTVRAKRAYYDFRDNRATLVEGVLRTKDRKGMALVARAQELRQYSQDQWEGDKLVVSTSEFFTPHLSVGVERATITRTLNDEGEGETLVQGQDVTIRSGTTPFFWFPGFEGTGDDIPFRGLGVSYSGDSGARIVTRWDLLTLMGMKKPKDADVTLYTDAWTNWGAGGGVKGQVYDMNFDLFGLYDFLNSERTSAGRDVVSDSVFRGLVHADKTFNFTHDTKLQTQLSYVSDESFMQVYRPAEFGNRLQKDTSAYFVSLGDRSEFSALLGYPTNDVITASNQLAARPYQVAKYPELAFKRWGDTLFKDTFTWHQEYSASAMSIRFGAGTTNGTGIRDNALNLLNQVMPDGNTFTRDTTIDELYQSSGYRQDTATRLYTRQELAMPLGAGGINFVPFASAAVTGYLTGETRPYNAKADSLRGLFITGVRFSTDIMANYDGAEIPFLDVHRLRHIATPYANAWYGYDSAPDNAYAVYDQDIEAATGRAAVQVGLRQRFQTMRGGPGNWQSVDWLVLDGGVTWDDGGDNLARTYTDGAQYRQSPFPQYFSWRPELSQWGRIAYGSFKWAASSSLSLSGNLTYMLDSNLPNMGDGPFGLRDAARGSIGALMQHAPDVRTFIEYRAINNNSPETVYESDALLAAGIMYKVSRTYELGFTPTYDLKKGDFRAFTLNINREMPDFTLMANFGYDAIVGEYYGGLAIRIGGGSGGGAGTGAGAGAMRGIPYSQ